MAENAETRIVRLWLLNVEGDYNYWQEAACAAWDAAEADRYDTREEKARYALADRMRAEMDTESTIASQISGMYSDLLQAALRQVEWHDIADGFLEGVDKAEASE